MNWLKQTSSFNHRGQSMIEFIIFAPMLLVFMLAIVDFSFLFLQHQRAATLTREGAISTLQKCPLSQDFDLCMDNAYDRFNSIAEKQFRDFPTKGALILSAWGYEKIDPTILTRLYFRGNNPARQITRFNSPADFNLNILDDNNPIFTIAEIYYEWTPLTSILNFLNLNLPEDIYEAIVA